jgi:muconolactone D-isomerase
MYHQEGGLMEFLVRWEITLPSDLGAEATEALRAAERAYGTDLWIRGLITRIWRVPGRRSVYVLWDVPDADALHDGMSNIPMFPYLNVESVEPLGTHPAALRYAAAAAAAKTSTDSSPSSDPRDEK